MLGMREIGAKNRLRHHELYRGRKKFPYGPLVNACDRVSLTPLPASTGNVFLPPRVVYSMSDTCNDYALLLVATDPCTCNTLLDLCCFANYCFLTLAVSLHFDL